MVCHLSYELGFRLAGQGVVLEEIDGLPEDVHGGERDGAVRDAGIGSLAKAARLATVINGSKVSSVERDFRDSYEGITRSVRFHWIVVWALVREASVGLGGKEGVSARGLLNPQKN